MHKKILLSAVLMLLFLACSTVFAAESPKKLKAGFALLWTIDDQGWTTSHYKGIEYLKKQLGDTVDVSYTEKTVSPADAERVIRGYAQKGYDVVFGTTFTHMDPMLAVAKDFPDLKFEHCSGYKTAPNMGTYFVRIYQAEYLAGYLAGLMGYKNVGTVATQPIPEIVRGINAFTLGLKRGLEESATKYAPEKLNTIVWLKAWRDPINETTLAETLAGKGHDLIRQMADTPDSAVAACANGVPAIGYGEDAASYGADCTLVSTQFNWGPYYVNVLNELHDGTWKEDQFWGGFKDDVVKLSPFGKAVPQDVREKVLSLKEQFEKGKDMVFTGPVIDQQGKTVIPKGQKATDPEMLSMRWFIQGVNGKLPE